MPPAKPVAAAKPVPPLKSAAPLTPPAVTVSIPAAPPEVKPAAPQSWPAVAAARTAPTTMSDNLWHSVPPPLLPPSVANIADKALSKVTAFDSSGVKLPTPAASAPSRTGLPATHGSGAASAPAPAREIHDSRVAAPPASTPADTTSSPTSRRKPLLASPPAMPGLRRHSLLAEPTPRKNRAVEARRFFSESLLQRLWRAPSISGRQFSTDTRASRSAFRRKPRRRQSSAASREAERGKPRPSTTSVAPATSAPSPVTYASVPSSQPAAVPAAILVKSAVVNNADTASNDDAPSPAASKPAAAPLVLKGGSAPFCMQTMLSSPPAPSMIGIATAGTSAPPPSIVSAGNAPTPVLQTLNVSQGVSQGLLSEKSHPSTPGTPCPCILRAPSR